MVTFWVISWAVAMIVAIPATPDSLMKGTTTTPESPLVVAVTVLAPLTLKRPRSVVKVTTVPAAEGLPLGAMSVAVIVVELAPSANNAVAPADERDAGHRDRRWGQASEEVVVRRRRWCRLAVWCRRRGGRW